MVDSFSKFTNAEHNRMERLRRSILSAHASLMHSRGTHAGMIAEESRIRATNDWRRCTIRTREYLRGFMQGLYESRWTSVQFAYVTPRGIVTTHNTGPAGVLCRLTDDECRNVDTEKYPRGFIWSSPAADGSIRWYCGPDLATSPATC